MNDGNGIEVLVRSQKGRMLAGICAGAAGYFGLPGRARGPRGRTGHGHRAAEAIPGQGPRVLGLASADADRPVRQSVLRQVVVI
jgi:hypothetical protein